MCWCWPMLRWCVGYALGIPGFYWLYYRFYWHVGFIVVKGESAPTGIRRWKQITRCICAVCKMFNGILFPTDGYMQSRSSRLEVSRYDKSVLRYIVIHNTYCNILAWNIITEKRPNKHRNSSACWKLPSNCKQSTPWCVQGALKSL
jgi:hypothetical protein